MIFFFKLVLKNVRIYTDIISILNRASFVCTIAMMMPISIPRKCSRDTTTLDANPLFINIYIFLSLYILLASIIYIYIYKDQSQKLCVVQHTLSGTKSEVCCTKSKCVLFEITDLSLLVTI